MPSKWKPGRESNWYVGKAKNPKSGAVITIKVCSDGKLTPTDQRRTGVERSAVFVKVRASNFREARQRAEETELVKNWGAKDKPEGAKSPRKPRQERKPAAKGGEGSRPKAKAPEKNEQPAG